MADLKPMILIKKKKMTLLDLEKWCMVHVCVDYSVIDDDTLFTVPLSHDYSNGSFRVFATTKRLLRTATWFTYHVASDDTYKLISQGFPVLMCGTTDKDHQFHPFCIVIS